MINFEPLQLSQRDVYNTFLFRGRRRGCEYSFANLYLWGRQRGAILGDHFVLFSQFNRRSVYPFPVGSGDVKPVLDAIMADARERDIPCRITGLDEEACRLIEQLYPGRFRIHCDRDSYDYVYDINDLADLKGRKFQKKRNHLNKFCGLYPNAYVTPITRELLPKVREMANKWYEDKLAQDPTGDFHMERSALKKAFDHLAELDMESLVLMDGEEVLAFTLGSPLSENTFDIHFEKAREDADGAYPAINNEFAKYLRQKYPRLQYLNREDDMGLEGLRKAKLSYNPHHQTVKHWAYLNEDIRDE